MEVEFIKALVDMGLGAVGIAILGLILFKTNKEIFKLIRSDQNTREKSTETLTKLSSCIEEFNKINGQSQRECNLIREALKADVNALERSLRRD